MSTTQHNLQNPRVTVTGLTATSPINNVLLGSVNHENHTEYSTMSKATLESLPTSLAGKQNIITSAIAIPTAGQVVTGDTVEASLSKLQTQLTNLVPTNSFKGSLANGGTLASPTVLTAGSMSLSTKNNDFYSVPTTAGAGYFQLPDGTVEKLTKGDRVVFNSFSNTYSVVPAGDNQSASEVPTTPIVASALSVALTSLDQQATNAEIAQIIKAKTTKQENLISFNSGTHQIGVITGETPFGVDQTINEIISFAKGHTSAVSTVVTINGASVTINIPVGSPPISTVISPVNVTKIQTYFATANTNNSTGQVSHKIIGSQI